jgi:hypothetical protein
VTADVISVNPQTQGLDAMLAKFNRNTGTTRMKFDLSSAVGDCSMSAAQGTSARDRSGGG